jgi:1-acyl-sn-glycerol-3-phosphate acyltransferase
LTSRHQGLGGKPLGSDSPLFGGTDSEAGDAAGSAVPPRPEAIPPWDPRADDYASPPGQPRIDTPEEAEAALAELRSLLPADEAGRSLDDWGRSEAAVSLVEPLLNFYYRRWFRVETHGIENVPDEGGALLVSNHAGALPPDAPMIMQAVRNEHSNPRPLYMLGEHWFKGYPFVSMIANKIGLVPAHRENAQRLLHDEGRLAIVFPEGQKGSRKLYWQRYRLRRFGRGGFVRTAIRARVPIVPIALVGAEEAMPIFAHLRFLEKLTGLIYFPVTPSFPQFGLAAPLMYMPAKFRIHFMEPVDMAQYPVETASDPAAVQAIAESIRRKIQNELEEMLQDRESVWTG